MTIIAEQGEAAVGSAGRTASVRWALASLSLSMLLSSLGTSIANVGLPDLAQAFDASFQEVQWIVLAYLLAITTLIVSVGRLGDIVGRRRLLLVGIFLFTMASGLCGVAPTLWLLIAARTAQGLGAAIMMALSMAFVGETVPKARTGSAMGLLGTMSAIGTALGPSLGGVLIAGLGWRAIFLVSIPLGILTFLVAYRHLPADRLAPKAERVGFDAIGTVLLALTLAAYALAMTIGRGSFGPFNVALLLAAVVEVGLFVRAEAKAASPLIRLAMFRDPSLSASLATSALVSTVMMATLVVAVGTKVLTDRPQGFLHGLPLISLQMHVSRAWLRVRRGYELAPRHATARRDAVTLWRTSDTDAAGVLASTAAQAVPPPVRGRGRCGWQCSAPAAGPRPASPPAPF